ncbi:hypothetical protein JL720_3952 [Aureococcus anophagefferens]|nr:hypothetical protein JL720_3952 [Aureococcus anophagefferens]
MAMMSQISLDVTGESTVARLPRAARGRGRGGGRATSSRRSGQEKGDSTSLQRGARGVAARGARRPLRGRARRAAAWRDALEGGQAPQLFFVPSNSGPPEGLDPKFFAKRLLSCHERRVEEGERRKSFLDQMIEQEAEEARLKEERRRYEAGDYASGDARTSSATSGPSQFAKLLVLRAFRPDLVQKGAELVAASVLAEDGEPAGAGAGRGRGGPAPVLVTVAADAEDDVFSLFPVVAAAAKTFMAEKNKGAYKASAPPRIAEVGLGSADANDAAATAVSEGRQWGRWVLRRDREVRKEERVAEQRAAGKEEEAAEAAEAQHEGKKDDSSPAPHHHQRADRGRRAPDWSGRGAAVSRPRSPARGTSRGAAARASPSSLPGVKARLVAALWDGGGSQSSARLYARLSDEHQRLYYAQFGPGEKKSALSDPDVLDEGVRPRGGDQEEEGARTLPQYEPTDSEGDEEDGRTAGTAKASAASHASEWQSDEDDSDCEDVSLPGQDKGDPTSLQRERSARARSGKIHASRPFRDDRSSLLTTSPNGLHLAIAGVWGRSPDARTQKGWDGVRDWIHNLPEGEDAELVRPATDDDDDFADALAPSDDREPPSDGDGSGDESTAESRRTPTAAPCG